MEANDSMRNKLSLILRGRSWSRSVSRFKAIEFQIYRRGLCFEVEHNLHISSHSIGVYFNMFGLLGWRVRCSCRCDHAGLHISITLFGFEISFEIYDIRHWDEKNGCCYNHVKKCAIMTPTIVKQAMQWLKKMAEKVQS